MKRDESMGPTKVSLRNLWFFFGVFSLAAILDMTTLSLAAEWPTKNITVNCAVGAGGFVDTSTRVVVSEMSKTLGVSIVVINIPGGGGGIGTENTYRAPNDGYTWVALGGGFRSLAVMGLHTSSPKEWYCVPTVGYIGAISVKEDSPYKNFPDLMEALKKNPGKIPYAASQPSTSWRIATEVMKKTTGLSGRYVTYPGSSPSQIALLSGDVQFILTGVGEQAELLKGKKIRALAVFDDKPYDAKGYGKIPAITDFLPQLKSQLLLSGWSAIFLRADSPKPILGKIDEAVLKAIQTNSVKEYCSKFEAFTMGVVGDDAQKIFQRQVSIDSWLLYDLGVAKLNPADFGIPKP